MEGRYWFIIVRFISCEDCDLIWKNRLKIKSFGNYFNLYIIEDFVRVI